MTSSGPATPRLDHIVILLPHHTLRNLPSSLTDSLTISPGGDHANGVTTNKLILFSDGVYIELIAFFDHVTPEQRRAHRWGDRPENTVVDFAYTLGEARTFSTVQDRVRAINAGVVYDDPRAGGRTREDGTVLEWATSQANLDDGSPLTPGLLPFWCLDKTERKLRVPYQGGNAAEHPSGVKGVSRVEVTAPAQHGKAIGKVYDAVHQDSTTSKGQPWSVDVPSTDAHGGASVALGEGRHGVEIVLTGIAGSPSYIEVTPGQRLLVES